MRSRKDNKEFNANKRKIKAPDNLISALAGKDGFLRAQAHVELVFHRSPKMAVGILKKILSDLSNKPRVRVLAVEAMARMAASPDRELESEAMPRRNAP